MKISVEKELLTKMAHYIKRQRKGAEKTAEEKKSLEAKAKEVAKELKVAGLTSDAEKTAADLTEQDGGLKLLSRLAAHYQQSASKQQRQKTASYSLGNTSEKAASSKQETADECFERILGC